MEREEHQVAIVIPLKDRATVDRTITSVLFATGLHEVLVVDGGSSDPACLEALSRSLASPLVTVLRHPLDIFSRAPLLNAGIQHSSADIVLVSDADIEWSKDVLGLLVEEVRRTGGFAFVDAVDETDALPVSTIGSRLSFRVSCNAGTLAVNVSETPVSIPSSRPGPGLVCARKSAWLAVGGYNTFFIGWGWEDQDLLMRAQLLGYPVTRVGRVRHISHANNLRDSIGVPESLRRSRDRNATLALSAIIDGRVHGPLTPADVPQPCIKVVVNAPQHLLTR